MGYLMANGGANIQCLRILRAYEKELHLWQQKGHKATFNAVQGG